MYPTRQHALTLLREGALLNPGPWEAHSRVVADCAEKIARRAGLDADKAYVLGLLHDIGRRFGRLHFGHIIYGYRYMLELGFDEAARVCLSHSFVTRAFEDVIGDLDVPKADQLCAREALSAMEFDDYDRLIQLCDAIGGTRVMDMCARMEDVKRRYGYYPQAKWDANFALKDYFERRMGEDIYSVLKGDGTSRL